MINFIRYIFYFPHVLVFIIYRKSIPEINQDLLRYSEGNTIRDFIKQLAKKEYRNVFYYRLPFLLRHCLNLLLHREKSCWLHTSSIVRWLVYTAWFFFNNCSRKNRKKFWV